jgi:hypothetical protein
MGKKQPARDVTGRGRYRFLKLLCALTILVACGILFLGGAQSGVRTVKTIYKCLAITAGIGIVFGIVIKVVQSYEETHGG